MNILVLTDEIYPDGVSGIGKSVYNECVALVRRGHQVTVLVRSLNSELPPEASLEGIRLFRFNGPPRSHRLYHLYPLVILASVTRWLLRQRQAFDVIYCFNPLYILPAWWTGVTRRVPLVHVFYSSMGEEIRINADGNKYKNRRGMAYAAAAVIGMIEKFAFARAALLLPRSAYTHAELRRIYPHAPVKTVLPTGVDIHLYQPESRSETRMRLNLPTERPIFITVRRLEGRMGLHNLIEAVGLVQQTHPDILLLIAGKGYLRPALEALVKDGGIEGNVRLLGFVSEAELPLYLAAADAFVLPTEMLEGFGLATVEALAVGVPVMGTPVGATPEILTLIDPHLVTQDNAPLALAETMNYWLDRRAELAALGTRSRAVAEQHYDADVIAGQLAELFGALTAKKDGSLN